MIKNEDYINIIQIMDECRGNIPLFLDKIEEMECGDKAQILLRIGASNIKKNAEMAALIEYGIQMLEDESDASGIENVFLCALGYEKINNYIASLSCFEKCIRQLPDSAMKCALCGMKYRVQSKKDGKLEDFNLSIKAFEKAASKEKLTWRRNKWKEAWQEMIMRKEIGWK